MKKRIKDLAYALKIPKDHLIELAENLDESEAKYYRNWDEPKTDSEGNPRYKDGVLQTRPINAPVKELKFVQSRILRNILYTLELPGYFFGGVKGKDAVLNARLHQGNKFFFLTDLKDFYPSINYAEVEAALRNFGFYPDVARVITRICTKEGSVPQGCPTSAFLASLVVYTLSGDLLEQYISEGLKVSIYIDDLTISSSKDFKSRSVKMIEDLRKRGLRINFEKTKYCTFNPVITGVVVKNNGISALPYTYPRSEDPTRSEASRKGYKMRIDYIKRTAKKKN